MTTSTIWLNVISVFKSIDVTSIDVRLRGLCEQEVGLGEEFERKLREIHKLTEEKKYAMLVGDIRAIAHICESFTTVGPVKEINWQCWL